MTDRTGAADWAVIAEEMNGHGCAETGLLLSPAECRSLTTLYDDVDRFRSTIDMARYRFGSGQYRYFARPFPELVGQLRTALYPRLLPIARDWADKLRRPAPWPDTLDEWLAMCHAAGQRKPTPILLRYGADDWNALHRDLYGDLVFPLQVVIGLDAPGVDHTPWVSSYWWSSARERSPEGRHGCCSRATSSPSPPATVRSGPPSAGRRHRCDTASAPCAPACGTPSVWSSTTRPETHD
ncbi:hypothetical protein BH18ACT7_BH18ACT7_03130 [soil metagenome]